ncbi:MAG: hypothetical protein WC454_05265, partial [Phycisphaerae bacterium]
MAKNFTLTVNVSIGNVRSKTLTKTEQKLAVLKNFFGSAVGYLLAVIIWDRQRYGVFSAGR